MICTRGVSVATGTSAGSRALVAAVVAVLVVAGSGLLPGPARAAEGSPTPSPGQSPLAEDPGAEDPEVAGDNGDAGEGEAPTPLTVSLTSLTPGEVPSSGPVVLEGTVRNDSDEVWRDVNAAVFLGADAMTTREEVAEATATPETTAVGNRLDLPGSFVTLGDLEPGAEAAYSVRVPPQALPDQAAPGVYWIGIHALGTNAEGRDSVADGRARTLIPLVSEAAAGSREVPVSLVVPLREPAPRTEDGSLAGPQRWVGRASTRLGRLADFADSSGSRPLSWLVDPAVLDALGDLGQGNPPLSLGPAERVDPTGQPGSGASGSGESADPAPASPSTSPPAAPAPESEIDGDGLPDPAQAAAARDLLDRLVQQLGAEETLALPYGDVDAVALARERPELLERAVEASAQSLGGRSLEALSVIAPPSGLVDLSVVAEVLPRLPDGTGVVMSDQGQLELPVTSRLELPGEAGADHPLLLTDARAAAGGPAPGSATEPLALRQRVLAEVAVEAFQAGQAGAEEAAVRPVVVVLPASYDPGPDWNDSDFFPELDTPWLELTELPLDAISTAPVVEPGQQPTPDDDADPDAEASGDRLELPAYPPEAEEAELPLGNVFAAENLLAQAEALDGLLANDNDVLPRLTNAALQATSYAARDRPRANAGAARDLSRFAQGVLDDVGVFGTEFVTLSGGSGTLTITLVNDLAQPVTVGVEVRSREEVRADSPDPVELGPEQRATLRLPVVSEEGVHDVDLQPVTSTGAEVGQPFGFVLRTSQVGRLVWFVMAGGALVFAVTLLLRVRQRLRERRERDRDTAAVTAP